MGKPTISEAQSEIDGKIVARMIMDFQAEFWTNYQHSVLASDLCAVGPLQSMIGLAIRNGRLALPTKDPDNANS